MRYALLVLLVGCATPRRGPTMAVPPELGPEAETGEALYMAQCQQCHPNGEGGMGPPLNNRHAPGWAIRTQIRLGAGAMPAFPHDELSGKDLGAIVQYMREVRRVRPEEEKAR